MMDLSLFKSPGSLKEVVPPSALSFSRSLLPLSMPAPGLSIQGAASAEENHFSFLFLLLFFFCQITFRTSCTAAQALMPAQTRELEHTATESGKGRTAALNSSK